MISVFLKEHKSTIWLVGLATFFFGFGAPALFNFVLFIFQSPLVLNFRSSLVYVSSIVGDGVILPIINMIAASFLLKNKESINKLTLVLALLLGFLITSYFHTFQASQNLINWAMPKPWEWNALGFWHALYMLAVSSLLSLYFLVLIKTLRKAKIASKELAFIVIGLVIFFILLRLDYIDVKVIDILIK